MEVKAAPVNQMSIPAASCTDLGACIPLTESLLGADLSRRSSLDASDAFAYKALWARAASEVAGELCAEAQNGKINALRTLSGNLKLEARALSQGAATAANTPEIARATVGKQYELLGHYAGMFSGLTCLDTKALRELLIKKVVSHLNNSTGWESIEALILVPQGEFKSTLIPLNSEFAAHTGAAHFEQYGATGKSSGTIKIDCTCPKVSERLTNGWQTSISNAEGDELFSAIRSGTLGAYGITDIALRESTSKKMAEELLAAAIAWKISKMDSHSTANILSGNETLRMGLVSLELQTDLRPGIAAPSDVEIGSPDLDLDTVAAQAGRRAMHSLNGQRTVRINLRDGNGAPVEREIKVEIEVIHFNYPVHEKVFLKGQGFGEHVLAQNRQAFNQLMPLAEKALEEAERSPGKELQAAKLQYVIAETREIYESEAYKTPGFDPYKMNSRLAVLAWLSGASVHFNCRSGKDRTGMLDAEAKAYAAQLELAVTRGLSELSPSYKMPPSSEQQELISQLALYGGNVEVQKLNTGVPGSKLKPVTAGPMIQDPLVQRVGIQNWEEFKGLSAAAST